MQRFGDSSHDCVWYYFWVDGAECLFIVSYTFIPHLFHQVRQDSIQRAMLSLCNHSRLPTWDCVNFLLLWEAYQGKLRVPTMAFGVVYHALNFVSSPAPSATNQT